MVNDPSVLSNGLPPLGNVTYAGWQAGSTANEVCADTLNPAGDEAAKAESACVGA